MVQVPGNEIQRLEALFRFNILDTEADEVYDTITSLAASIMEVPMAAINLIDADRFFLKSKIGFSVDNGPREDSICAHTILDVTGPLIVPDTSLDIRFSNNPYVVGAPNIRFYFGQPLVTSSKEAIGSLCTLDSIPKDSPTKMQLKSMQYLSKLIMKHLELREQIFSIYNEFQKLKTLPINTSQAEIFKIYDRLSDNCDAILEKIKARKQKKQAC